MRITYSPKADAMYIYFQKAVGERGAVKQTLKAQEGILLDIGQNDKLFGIEILDVSKRMSLDTIKTVTLDLSAEKVAV